MAGRPSLEEFEGQLRRLMAVETEIAGIAPVHAIGALCLELQPLKLALRAEAASWKAQFARNLHRKGAEELRAFDARLADLTARLGRRVEDLDDVKAVAAALREVHETEAGVDAQVAPIEDLYALLLR